MHPPLPSGILAGIVGAVRHSAGSGWHVTVPPGIIDGAVRIGFAFVAFAVCWLLRKPLQWLLVQMLVWLVHLSKRSREVSRAALHARIREIVAIPTNYLALAISLDVAAQILHFAGVAELLTRLSYTLFGIMVALLIGRYINYFIIGRDRRLDLLGLAVEPPLLPFLHSFVWAFIFFVLLVAVMQGWGFDPAALIAGTGLVGLALSLAAKDTADNLLGYFIIVAERPFLIGDFIKAGDVAGVVEHVGWRSTKVRQMDQVLVTVPNKNLTSANIANSQRMAKQMLETHLNVAYNAPPAAIQRFLDSVRAMLAARPLVEPDSIVALLLNLNKDSLDVLVRCNILETRWLLFRTEQEAIMLELLRLVEDAGLEVALPSQKVLVQAVAPAPGAPLTDTANGAIPADHPA
jgi:MscS family membrane protein